ncbi:hypothetical protein PILCRDRAFT_467407 [Piloderma croceum F 1598]|uniref:Cytochrome P450 n=1 Tax=Piloderma croceum (strain F 1598) TaxID=765440 RepID=A0A0C3B8I3_PILCF|nr:hypothetical protein PILCRDRAFT_467407 [Piloderma croceum F 1598]
MQLSQLASHLFLSAGATLVIWIVFKAAARIIRSFKSPLRNIRGPNSSHWFYGNYMEITRTNQGVIEQWVQKYGSTLKFNGFANAPFLCTMDSRALNHIFSHPYDYHRPEIARSRLAPILGKGLLLAEDDPHKQQRKIMNPAFGPIQVRTLTEIFTEKATQLRNILMDISIANESAPIDALSWLSKATLDIIGLAGFNYKFNALNSDAKPDELNEAFATLFGPERNEGIFPILQAWVPALRIIPTAQKKQAALAQKTMHRIGRGLLNDSKAAAASAEKDTTGHRDLLSLLVRVNIAVDLPENQKLSDADVLAQIGTFIVAGHETTSTATAWALFSLTQSPEVQNKLREELLQISTESPTMEDLMGLPYLDAVVRETLRLHSPVASLAKVAMKDDLIPLDIPFIDIKGNTQRAIRINKGDSVFIPVRAVNRSKSVWGEDAAEFRPERWESIPEAAHHVPGVWGNQLSFSAGPRACIGYRFSLVEMKALLFALVRAFEFELAVPAKDIAPSSTSIVQRPHVLTELEKGSQLPVFIKPYIR